jgi:hypothetical protein
MGLDDATNDGQAETGARLTSLASTLGTPETVEETLRGSGRQARPMVAHANRNGVAILRDRHLDRRLGRGVHERVAHQVGEHLTELMWVA